MPSAVCVKCQLFFKIKKNGVAFEEGHGDGKRRPYKLWVGDLYKCQGCGSEIIVGMGRAPVAEHYERGYANSVREVGATIFVDDCPGQYREKGKAA